MSYELSESFPGVVYWCLNDDSWTMLRADGGCSALTGYECDILESSRVTFGHDLIHPADRRRVSKDVQRSLAEGEAFEVAYRIETKRGETKWVHESGHGVSKAGATQVPGTTGEIGSTGLDDQSKDTPMLIEGYIREIATERPLASEQKRKAQLLDSIFDSIPIHLFVKDRDGRHLYVSEEHTEAYDGVMIGKTDLELCGVDESHRKEAYEDDMHVIETGEPILDKEEYINASEKWNLTSKVPWRGPSGEIRGLIGLSRDITERKRRQEEVERQRDRLEQFARVVSHDLRNPLNVAQGRVELAKHAAETEAPTAHLETTQNALDRMQQLLADLLTLARSGQPEFTSTTVLLDSVATDAWQTVPTDGLTLAIETEQKAIEAEESRLRQLFENLFNNAAEHAQPASKESETTVCVGCLDAGFYVSDTGPGIPKPARSDVFQPGYSTEVGGTGFGLAIVQEIADAHGWETQLTESEAGGARFEFRDVKVGNGK